VWTLVGAVNEIVTGSTPPKNEPKYYSGGNIPFVKPNDLGQGRWMETTSELISEEGYKISRPIPPNSTLLCCIGSIGKSAYCNFYCVTNQQINALIPLKMLYLQKPSAVNWAQTSQMTKALWNC